jgi:hypothetical protein
MRCRWAGEGSRHFADSDNLPFRYRFGRCWYATKWFWSQVDQRGKQDRHGSHDEGHDRSDLTKSVNLYSPGPQTMRLVWYPVGVMKAQEADTIRVMAKGMKLTPN